MKQTGGHAVPEPFADILISEQKDWLYGLCHRLEHVSQDADDLFQDTWLKALGALSFFLGDSITETAHARPPIAEAGFLYNSSEEISPELLH
jgi:hypothetical protein